MFRLQVYAWGCACGYVQHAFKCLTKCVCEHVRLYLLDSLYHRLQPVSVDLTVAVQKGQDRSRGRVGSSHAWSDQTWRKHMTLKSQTAQMDTVLLNWCCLMQVLFSRLWSLKEISGNHIFWWHLGSLLKMLYIDLRCHSHFFCRQ